MPRRIAVFLAIAALSLTLDQASKVWARRALGPQQHQTVKEVIPGYFDLRLSYNPGVAFGMFGRTNGARYFLTIVGVAAFAAIVVFVFKAKEAQRRLPIALGAIAGGAIGNVVDRVAFGQVTDFVVWRIGKHEWPTFNIADAALVAGVVLLFIDMQLTKKPAPAEATSSGKKKKASSRG